MKIIKEGNTKRAEIHDKTFKMFIPYEKIRDRIRTMAREIESEHWDTNPLFIVVLNGAFMFASDLLKDIAVGCEVTFVKVSSYNGMSSTGEFTNLIGLKEDINDRTIIIVEDIVDTGETVRHLMLGLNAIGKPKDVKIATMLYKPDVCKLDGAPDYTGFNIPDMFVVGHGLDYNGHGRNLRDIYVVEQHG